MPSSENIAALVNQIPELDEKNPDLSLLRVKPKRGKLTGPVWAKAEKLFDQVLEGGKAGVADVIDMIQEVDDGTDYKARYMLHGLATYVCRPEKKAHRAAVVGGITSKLAGKPKPTQAFLLRQLQVCGGAELCALLGGLLTDEELCQPAAAALVAIGKGAAEQFRAALPKARGKCRMTIVQNLGVVRDTRSARALRRAVRDPDRGVRIAAAWALANIADPAAVDVLIRASNAEPGWERIEATKACLLLAEKLLAAGRKAEARSIYMHLRDTRKEASEKYVREAAEKALAGGQ